MDYGLLSFLLTVLIINVAPGPAMMFVINQSLRHGVRTGLKAAGGVEFGVLFYVAMAAFGLMIVFKEWPALYQALQVMGIIYLVYLSYVSWPRPNKQAADAPAQKAGRSGHSFLKGMLITLTNPKIGLFFVGLLPQFIPSSASPAWRYFLLYGLIFNAGGLVVNSIVAIVAHKINIFIDDHSWFRYAPSVLFIIIASKFIYTLFGDKV